MFIKFFKKNKLNIFASVVAVFILLAIWTIAYFTERNDYVLPSVWDTAKSLFAFFATPKFWLSLGYTMLATLAAFAVSFALAAIFVCLCETSKFFSEVIKVIVAFVRTIPTLAAILIILVWASFHAVPYVAPAAVTVLVLFPLVFSQLLTALSEIDEGILEACKVYEISKRDVIFKIKLPLCLSPVLAQSGANYSLGLKVMISAEVLAMTRHGYGVLMQTARFYPDIPALAALTLAAVFVGGLVNLALSPLNNFGARWKKKEGGYAD